jgi:hypothetical protein
MATWRRVDQLLLGVSCALEWRSRDHRPRSTVSTRRSTSTSTSPPTLTTIPPGSRMSMCGSGCEDGVPPGVAGASALIRTDTPLSPLLFSATFASNWRRQVKSWPGAMPCARATCETVDSGRADSATIRSLSSRLHRRRRSTDVITLSALIVLAYYRDKHSTSRNISTRQPPEDTY